MNSLRPGSRRRFPRLGHQPCKACGCPGRAGLEPSTRSRTDVLVASHCRRVFKADLEIEDLAEVFREAISALDLNETLGACHLCSDESKKQNGRPRRTHPIQFKLEFVFLLLPLCTSPQPVFGVWAALMANLGQDAGLHIDHVE